jgi:hypothetical protein
MDSEFKKLKENNENSSRFGGILRIQDMLRRFTNVMVFINRSPDTSRPVIKYCWYCRAQGEE